VAISDDDLERLRRCRLYEDRNRVKDGVGRIVYATSSEQLTQWLAEWGAHPPPVAPLPIATVAPRADVHGPAPELADTMKALYEAKFRP
jgi:hypothetical protein